MLTRRDDRMDDENVRAAFRASVLLMHTRWIGANDDPETLVRHCNYDEAFGACGADIVWALELLGIVRCPECGKWTYAEKTVTLDGHTFCWACAQEVEG